MFNPSDLSNFIGTENYYRFPLARSIVYTDGCQFLMANGAGWVVSDALIILAMEKKVAREEFVAVKVKVTDPGTPKAKATIFYEDGNDKVLFKQKYDGTDLPCDLLLFRENGVLMLASER